MSVIKQVSEPSKVVESLFISQVAEIKTNSAQLGFELSSARKNYYNCDIISNMIQMQGFNQDKKIFENVKNLSVGKKSINTPSSQVEN